MVDVRHWNIAFAATLSVAMPGCMDGDSRGEASTGNAERGGDDENGDLDGYDEGYNQDGSRTGCSSYGSCPPGEACTSFYCEPFEQVPECQAQATLERIETLQDVLALSFVDVDDDGDVELLSVRADEIVRLETPLGTPVSTPVTFGSTPSEMRRPIAASVGYATDPRRGLGVIVEGELRVFVDEGAGMSEVGVVDTGLHNVSGLVSASGLDAAQQRYLVRDSEGLVSLGNLDGFAPVSLGADVRALTIARTGVDPSSRLADPGYLVKSGRVARPYMIPQLFYVRGATGEVARQEGNLIEDYPNFATLFTMESRGSIVELRDASQYVESGEEVWTGVYSWAGMNFFRGTVEQAIPVRFDDAFTDIAFAREDTLGWIELVAAAAQCVGTLDVAARVEQIAAGDIDQDGHDELAALLEDGTVWLIDLFP